MDDAGVGDDHAGAVAGPGDRARAFGKGFRALRPRGWGEAVQGLKAERIEAEGNTGDRRLDMVAVDVAHDRRGGVRRARRGVDQDRNAVVQPDVFQKMGDGLAAVAGQTRAIGALRAGEDDMQAVGAAVEVFERKLIGGVRIGEIDAAENGPAAGRAAQGARRLDLRARVERGDGGAVIGFGDELVEGAALQRLIDELEPLIFGRLWKNPGDGSLIGAHLDLTPHVSRAFCHEAPPQGSGRCAATAIRQGRSDPWALFSAPKPVTKAHRPRWAGKRRRESRLPASMRRVQPTAREGPRPAGP